LEADVHDEPEREFTRRCPVHRALELSWDEDSGHERPVCRAGHSPRGWAVVDARGRVLAYGALAAVLFHRRRGRDPLAELAARVALAAQAQEPARLPWTRGRWRPRRADAA
jgi:hypothetical protein